MAIIVKEIKRNTAENIIVLNFNDIVFITPILPYSYVSPPCWNAIKGGLIGASQESSIDDPCVNAPAAIITWSV